MKKNLHRFTNCLLLILCLLGTQASLAQPSNTLQLSGTATANSTFGTSFIAGDAFNWSVTFDLDAASTGSTPSYSNTFNNSVVTFSLEADSENEGEWDPSAISWPISPAANVAANANGNQITVQLRPSNAPDLDGLSFFDLGFTIFVGAAGLDPAWIAGSTTLATWLGNIRPDLKDAGISFELRHSGTSGSAIPSGPAISAVITHGGVDVPVDGVCGEVAAAAFAPSAESMCTAGTADGVAEAGTIGWTWSCDGSGGGEASMCSAPYADTATGSGDAWAEVAGSTWTVDTDNSGFMPADSAAPANVELPHGLLSLRLTNGSVGSSATVTINYPEPLPAGTVYWKYGGQVSQPSPHWYVYPHAVISDDRMSIVLTLTDGGQGDDDLVADGVISDPGGPGIAMAASAHAIPTLSEWMLTLLAGMVLLVGVKRTRKYGALRPY